MELSPETFAIARHNGMVTIRSKRTGDHRTFSVKTIRKGSLADKRIVSLLTGPDREDWTAWQGFGFVEESGAIKVWGKYRGTDFETFGRMLENPAGWTEKADFLIEGKCRRCNRPLTVPESIENGYGPECVKHI